MPARQLDLFGATSAEVAPSAPHALGRAAPHDSELADSPGVRCEPALTGDSDALLPECADDRASVPFANVEPYRFTLADPSGRWTITAAHEDEQARGKAKRSLVARCSCGWVQPFSARSYGTVSPDRLLAHLRTHQLTATPPAFVVEEHHEGWDRVRLVSGRMHCASAECHRLAPNDHRVQGGFAEPCPEHEGSLHERPYHWEEHDPEDHSGEPRTSHKSFLRSSDGLGWHCWCAPVEGRRLFGFVHADEEAARDEDRDSDDSTAESFPMGEAATRSLRSRPNHRPASGVPGRKPAA